MINDQNMDRLNRYLDGNASAEDVEQLNARLREGADARKQFIELLNLDSALEAVSESSLIDDLTLGNSGAIGSLAASADSVRSEPVHSTADSSADSSGRLPMGWLIAAAACIALAFGGLWSFQEPSQPWATVKSHVGVDELANGTELRDKPHQINAGMVQLVTARGARVVIEAPALFQFESANRLRLTRGRLSADVPPSAKGFTVVTPSGEAVDLGTRFGVDVPVDGTAEIHVFQGEVIAKASGSTASDNLYTGEAMTLAAGTNTARDLRSSAFIQPDEMSELAAGHVTGRQTQAEASIAAIRNDPALIALLDFEADKVHPGVFRMAQGRWPGSRAPEFVSVGDHMKLNVGEDREWSQLTLAAWVRLDRLGSPYQSLLHTDGWDQNKPGQVHWMVTKQTTMRLALDGNTLAPGSDELEDFPDSRTPVLPEQGRWVHLVTVYDAEARTVRFYLNGKFDKEGRQAIAHPAKLGPSQIGNWSNQDRKLSGRIDELIILGRAMSDTEIQNLFVAGSPYPSSDPNSD